MKRILRVVPVLAVLVGLASPGSAAVLFDDTWADGTRTNQNLPVKSAWYASTGESLTATTNSMTLALEDRAVLAMTFFTSNATSPVQLKVGDTLTASFTLVLDGVAAQNGSLGFRLGLFNFADSTLADKRVSADSFNSGSQGNGVQGYALFQNMGATFSSVTPMDIRKRTSLTEVSLLGASRAWTSLGSGPGDTSTFAGFANGTRYILQLTLQRTALNSLTIAATWLNTESGATLSTSVIDNGAINFRFDGIALRPQNAMQSASTITFHEVRVESAAGSTPPSISVQPRAPPSISVQPRDQAGFSGENVTFTAVASGTALLSYQWYHNTGKPVANATRSTLTLTNVHLADAGGYSVLVSNFVGSATSKVATLTVTIPVAPSIITQPRSLTVSPGQRASFGVLAGGTEPLNYQWYYNATTLLANATNATFVLANVRPRDAGSYSVVVSSPLGSVTSSDAILSVNPSP